MVLGGVILKLEEFEGAASEKDGSGGKGGGHCLFFFWGGGVGGGHCFFL